ncbi:MAG: hypothetical protein MJ025_05680 [Victivallaceae bacterium]|nr:hypothetical protein [Victivallaceae bacterium]
MKKVAIILLATVGIVFSSSADSVTRLVDDTLTGVLYCDMQQMVYVGNKMPSRAGVKVLGKAEAKADTYTVLALVAFGDTSMELLKRKALQSYPEADELIDIEIDRDVFSVLFLLYKQVTVTLRGTAIKYVK